MRLEQKTDGRIHPTDGGPNDHHPQPVSVPIENTSQSLPPGTDYNLNISLPHSGYNLARAQIMGPRTQGSSGLFNEVAELIATTNADEAMGKSVVINSFKTSYVATYSKQNGDTYLTHKIFDNDTGSSALYIAVTATQIISSVLRITFHNYYGGSATLWVKGQAILW